MRDNYREIPDEKIIDAPETPGFGEWADLFSEGAKKHPAKMSQNLVRHLLERYTREGDVVLDPMAGAMSTVVQAALMGRRGVGVEYEGWMIEAAKATFERLEKHARQTLSPHGSAVALHGDARQLGDVLATGGTDAAIFSPPYEDSLRSRPRTVDEAKMGDGGRGFLEQHGYDLALTSPLYGDTAYETKDKSQEFWDEMARRTKRPAWADPNSRTRKTREAQDGAVDAIFTSPPYSESIGHLPYGAPDVVLTSPPHEDAVKEHNASPEAAARRADRMKAWMERGVARGQKWSVNKDVGKMMAQMQEAGYSNPDAVVMSPPHGGGQGHSPDPHPEKLEESATGLPRGYTVDRIVMSPPYEGSQPFRSDLDPAFVERMRESMPPDKTPSTEAELAWLKRAAEGRKTTRGNIGRTSGPTYLEAMLQVYTQCFAALKPGGLIVVVVKNPTRNWRPLRLDLDTAKLLEASGFREKDHLYRPLRTKSFWIRNFENRWPKLQALSRLARTLAPAARAELEKLVVPVLAPKRDGKPPTASYRIPDIADLPLPTTSFEDILVFEKPDRREASMPDNVGGGTLYADDPTP